MDLFEEASDCVGHYVSIFCFRHWTEAVKDRDDDNDDNCIGKGKLRELCAFGDSSKSVGSRNGNSGFGRLFRVQFKLDFHFHASKKGRKLTII